MGYKAFALKWRPQNFEEVVGQEHITTTLKNAIKQKRIAHAYLFTGPRGTGKTSTARIFAKALNCQAGPTPNPCNRCQNCQEITLSNSLDVLEIDGASNRGIDEIRNLRGNVKLSAASSRYKIYIIDEVHMLTEPAFNALLKTLEEPPVHVKFIFATTHPEKIIPTIISRCQRFDFRRIPTEDIANKLKEIVKEEKLKIDEEAIYLIAKFSEGALRDAESILDQLSSYTGTKITVDGVNSIMGSVGQKFTFDITERIIDKDTAGSLNLLNEVINKGKDLSIFVLELIEHFRNLMIAKEIKDLKEFIDISENYLEKIKKQAEHFSKEDLLYIFSLLSKVQDQMGQLPIHRIPLEMALIKLTKKTDIISTDSLLEKLESLENKLKEHNTNDVPTNQVIKDKNTPPGSNPRSLIKENPKESDVTQNELLENTNFNHEEFKPLWEKACQMIKQIKTPAGLYIAEGIPVGLEKNLLTVGFYPGFSFHKENLEEKVNRKLIEKTFSELLNKKIKIKFIDISSRPKKHETVPKEASATSEEKKNPEDENKVEKKNPLVSSALKLFGGLIIRDESKKTRF